MIYNAILGSPFRYGYLVTFCASIDDALHIRKCGYKVIIIPSGMCHRVIVRDADAGSELIDYMHKLNDESVLKGDKNVLGTRINRKNNAGLEKQAICTR